MGVVKIELTEGRVATLRVTMKGGGEQVNGRERETATLLSRRPLNLNLSVAVSPHVISTVRRQSVNSSLVNYAKEMRILWFDLFLS